LGWDRTLDERIINLVDGCAGPCNLTLDAMADSLQAARSTVAYHVAKLERAKRIKRMDDGRIAVTTPVRQLALALDVHPPNVIDITERVRERGLLRHSAQLRGFYNLLLTVQLPIDVQPEEIEQMLLDLGAREVRQLGELVVPDSLDSAQSAEV
jgi:DNA-binding Lrp family transcriptional regulator